MKKALWLQLPRFRSSRTLDTSVDEVTYYRRFRRMPRLRPERAEQQRRYDARVKEWLRFPENRWCRVYLLLLGKQVRATQCHHYQGRRGMLLLHELFWIPVSYEGHRWIDDHRERARELGLLCPLGRYNSPVSTASSQHRDQ